MGDDLADRRTFLKFGAALGPAALAAQRSGPNRPYASRQGQPNIILIYADDLGYGDLGCYGSDLATPNLDRMAAQGVRFQQCGSANPVCSPARAALLTGRYPTRVGVPDVLQPDSTTGLSLSETTMADMLKAEGYATMCIGKWHLGSVPQYMPTQRGFDAFYGLPYSNDMSPLPLIQNTTVIEQPAILSTLTQRYTGQAVSFITSSKDRPFFLYMPHTFPHIPLAASPAFQGTSGFGLFGDVVEEIDWSVGQVLGAVQNNGLDDNTLVMFSSDHGPWFLGSAGRLHGRKGETWEGGVRVPFIARFPGRIPAGRVATGFASTMDILPTVARLCGATLPSNPLDGIDIWPLMAGERDTIDRDAFLYFDSVNLQCARLGPWKLHVTRYNTPPWIPIPANWRQNMLLATSELYNLEADPEESYDAASDHPDIVASIRARMNALILTFPDNVQSFWNNITSTAGTYCPSGGWPCA
ncbi:MAG: sulfatase [Bryobacteraceae bacterium]|jgi:arylsulfatase